MRNNGELPLPVVRSAAISGLVNIPAHTISLNGAPVGMANSEETSDRLHVLRRGLAQRRGVVGVGNQKINVLRIVMLMVYLAPTPDSHSCYIHPL